MITFRCFSRQRPARGLGAGDHQHRHGVHNFPPASPMRKLHKIIRPHQPDKLRAREAAFEGTQRVAGITSPQAGFEISGDNPPAIGNPPCRVKPRGQAAHASGWFERIARRNQQPELIQPEMLDGLPRDIQMPRMGRVERSAEQADF